MWQADLFYLVAQGQVRSPFHAPPEQDCFSCRRPHALRLPRSIRLVSQLILKVLNSASAQRGPAPVHSSLQICLGEAFISEPFLRPNLSEAQRSPARTCSQPVSEPVPPLLTRSFRLARIAPRSWPPSAFATERLSSACLCSACVPPYATVIALASLRTASLSVPVRSVSITDTRVAIPARCLALAVRLEHFEALASGAQPPRSGRSGFLWCGISCLCTSGPGCAGARRSPVAEALASPPLSSTLRLWRQPC